MGPDSGGPAIDPTTPIYCGRRGRAGCPIARSPQQHEELCREVRATRANPNPTPPPPPMSPTHRQVARWHRGRAVGTAAAALTRGLGLGAGLHGAVLVVDGLAGQGEDADLGHLGRGVLDTAAEAQHLAAIRGTLHHLGAGHIPEWTMTGMWAGLPQAGEGRRARGERTGEPGGQARENAGPGRGVSAGLSSGD